MEFTITEKEKKILLSDARETITAELDKRKPFYHEEDIEAESNLKKPCGAFVSLHIEPGHSLRGCIGRMAASLPLIETVREMAEEAAFSDPRFPPLRKNELSNLHIEISVLSPMSLCPDYRRIKVGVHGLLLRRGYNSGVLLPQVPVEQGWNLEQYLEYICIKAGVPAGSYKAKDAELSTFTAVVFGE